MSWPWSPPDGHAGRLVPAKAGIENEAFNTLKTKGYNLEHNFGHGQQHLASVLATLNLLAFACHTVLDLVAKPWKAAQREVVTRQGFFQTMLALTAYVVFPSWDHLLGTKALRAHRPWRRDRVAKKAPKARGTHALRHNENC